MKTIADFKRRMQLGTLVQTKNYRWNKETNEWVLSFDYPVRPVSIIQSNSFAFKTEKIDGTFSNSWCDWPKKDQFVVLDENTVQLTEPGFSRLIYQFV